MNGLVKLYRGLSAVREEGEAGLAKIFHQALVDGGVRKKRIRTNREHEAELKSLGIGRLIGSATIAGRFEDRTKSHAQIALELLTEYHGSTAPLDDRFRFDLETLARGGVVPEESADDVDWGRAFHNDRQCGTGVCRREAWNRCAACRTQRYCSAQCQQKDWPRHKPECKRAQADTKAAKANAPGYLPFGEAYADSEDFELMDKNMFHLARGEEDKVSDDLKKKMADPVFQRLLDTMWANEK
jgi:hypothetical protein